VTLIINYHSYQVYVYCSIIEQQSVIRNYSVQVTVIFMFKKYVIVCCISHNTNNVTVHLSELF